MTTQDKRDRFLGLEQDINRALKRYVGDVETLSDASISRRTEELEELLTKIHTAIRRSSEESSFSTYKCCCCNPGRRRKSYELSEEAIKRNYWADSII